MTAEHELGLAWDQPLEIRDLDHLEHVLAFISEVAQSDDEAAHAYQDKLLLGTLRAIAAGAPNAAELATRALAVDDIDFARWYA